MWQIYSTGVYLYTCQHATHFRIPGTVRFFFNVKTMGKSMIQFLEKGITQFPQLII